MGQSIGNNDLKKVTHKYCQNYLEKRMKAADYTGRLNPARSQSTNFEGDKQLRFGILDGSKVKVQHASVDIDDRLEIEYQRKVAGLDAPEVNLAQKKLNYNIASNKQNFSKSEIQQYIRALGNSKSSSTIARNILQKLIHDEPIAKPGRTLLELVDFQVALQRIGAALGGSDDEFVEWMSPLKSETPDLLALAQKLQEAGDDAGKMRSLLEDFPGITGDKQNTAQQFATTRFDLKQLKRQLRDLQELPVLDEGTKALIKEKVEDELGELLALHGSHLQALKNLLDKAGDVASKEVAETYDSLLHSATTGFAATAETLLEQYSDNVLLETVIPLFEKTLSHELQLSDDMRSVDKEMLYATLSEIQNMHILKTLIERINTFLLSLRRMYGVADQKQCD